MGIFDNLMAGGKKLTILQGVDSTIGEKAKFKGELVTNGSLTVSGEFEGRIRAEGEVIVSPPGKVVGEVYGGMVVISGRVDGNITAKDTLEISKVGRVHGDIVGGKIVIEEGATYHGKVKVDSGPGETASVSGGEESQPPS